MGAEKPILHIKPIKLNWIKKGNKEMMRTVNPSNHTGKN